MAGKDDRELKTECVGNGQMQQTFAWELDSEVVFSVPMAIQVAWSAVLGCYTGSNDVVFDILHDHETANDNQAPAGTIKVQLERNNSAQLAMDKMSQLEIQPPESESSDILLAFADVDTKHPRKTSHGHTHAQYELSVECSISDKLVSLRAVYKEPKWTSETIYFVLRQMRHAMNLMTASLSVPVSALQGTSEESWKQLMDWDPAPLREASIETVWEAIEKRCKEQPLHMAIESWDGQVTYLELEQRVSAAAERLSQLGLPPGTFIGLLLEKSLVATVAMLGVVKAGHAFVLLDASQPAQRLRTMCSMAAVGTVIASPSNVDTASCLGIPFQSTHDFPRVPCGSRASHIQPRPSSLLYAGFTSGSTGEPKGFLIRHGNFMSGLDEYCAGLHLGHDARVFQFASYAFVVSITGQLAPLTRGACLCVPSQKQLEHDLAGAVTELRANWLAVTPSAARTLDPQSVPSLKTVVMVGEEMSSSDLARWGHLDLYSLYGQSENAKGTMIARKTGKHVVPGIGRPFYANAWIVDRADDGILLPVGAEGELVLESPCLAEEYINSPSQTEASFVRNPSWARRLGRQGTVTVFKTGDLARRDATDGSFQLLGRKGTRIKIRGQRVELGEVEHHIRRLLPAASGVAVDIVWPCAAAAREQPDPLLVAFLVLHAAGRHEEHQLLLAAPTAAFEQQALLVERGLKEVLPVFMVPAAYLAVAALPRTSTGKLDRRRMRAAAAALSRRALTSYSSVAHAAYTAPRSADEAVLRELCAETLQLPSDEVGMDDTFVHLGGDSLLARHLIARARARGVSVSLQNLLRPATLAQLAERSRATGDEEARDVPRESDDADGFAALREAVMSSLPDGLGRDEVQDVLPTLETQGAYVSNRVVDCCPVHMSGPVDAARLRTACHALVARHAILRTVFHYHGKRLVQVVLRDIPVSYVEHACDGWDAAMRRVDEFASQELRKRHDIGRPIVGFLFVTVPVEARHILVLRLSHGQYDGLSLRPLMEDLWAAYQGLPQPAPPTDFKAHVLDCYRSQTTAAYNIWRGVLRDAPPSPLFPQLPAADDPATHGLTMLALAPIRPVAGATAASMVKAAWFEVLRGATRQEDLVFGQFLHAGSGRAVVGPCMNVVPVRVRRSPGQTRRQVLRAIQAQHAATAPAHGLGWSDVVARCTDWGPRGTADSVVLHQNFDRSVRFCADGGVVWDKKTPVFSAWAVFPLLLVTLPGEDRLEALLLLSSRYRGLCDPVAMLGSFARAMEFLQSRPDEVVDMEEL